MQRKFHNYYKAFNIKSDAAPEDIKRVYRKLARRLHPDSNPHNPGAAVQFRELTTAYEILSDAAQRQAYHELYAELKRCNPLGFSVTVTPSRSAVSPHVNEQVMYLLLNIKADQRSVDLVQQYRRSPLNLTLVLDQSNSMNGERLDRVKVAAHKLIDQLTEEDILSVVAFNDRASIVIPSMRVTDKATLKARISMLQAGGSTEMLRGLSEGVEQNKQFLHPQKVNHLILLTDGNTYGDEEKCIQLGQEALQHGITISTMGLGDEWNDEFLDALASVSGGTCSYINSSRKVVQILNEHVRSLTRVFAERMQLTIAPDPDMQLELAFKVLPQPQPLVMVDGVLPLGSLGMGDEIQVLVQMQLPKDMSEGTRSMVRFVVSGDILDNPQQNFQVVVDMKAVISAVQAWEETPESIIHALSTLTIHRLQDRAQDAVKRGDMREATRRLQNLATCLLQIGEEDLARQAVFEAEQVQKTNEMSGVGRKELKYQTRTLMLPAGA